MTITPEQRRQIARLGGLARSKQFTSAYQKAARAKQTPESCATKGRKSFAVACAKFGLAGAMERFARRRREHPSELERIVRDWLDQQNIAHCREVICAGIYVDFLLDDGKTVIEVDGTTWHTLDPLHGEDRRGRDTIHEMVLTANGYRVIRLAEAAIKSGEFARILEVQL